MIEIFKLKSGKLLDTKGKMIATDKRGNVYYKAAENEPWRIIGELDKTLSSVPEIIEEYNKQVDSRRDEQCQE